MTLWENGIASAVESLEIGTKKAIGAIVSLHNYILSFL